MGRKNKTYRKDLKQQAFDRLKSMESYGESKKQAMLDGTAKDKIFSYNTMMTYRKHIVYFCDWIKETHPEIKTLRAAKNYTNDWLDYRTGCVNNKGEPLSAWTLQTDAKAIGKLYGITPNDPDYWVPPIRQRADIKRSRNEVIRDAHFSEKNNAEFVSFCKATGLRRSELANLKGKDLVKKVAIENRITEFQNKQPMTDAERNQLKMLIDTRLFPDVDYFVYVKRGKGGRQRLVPLALDKDLTDIVINRMNSIEPEAKVWPRVSTNADIHSYRASFCCDLYRKYTRNQSIGDLPYDAINKGTGRKYQSGVYICRKDTNRRYIRNAMLLCSNALGHNRISIIAENYLWQL